MAKFVREDEDKFLWTYQEPQLFEPKYTEEVLHVLEAKQVVRAAEAVEQPGTEWRVRTAWTEFICHVLEEERQNRTKS